MKVFIGDHPEGGKEKQVVDVQIDRWDTLDLSRTLALIILPALEKMRSRLMWTPVCMINKDCATDSDGNPTPEESKLADEKWQLIVDKMIWSFQQVIDLEVDAFKITEGEFEWPEFPKDGREFFILDDLNWKVEPVQNENAKNAYYEHIREGLELFGKYFWLLGE